MRLQSRPIDRQRAARLVLAFTLDDAAALDGVLRECDADEDPGVTGVLLALVDFAHGLALTQTDDDAS